MTLETIYIYPLTLPPSAGKPPRCTPARAKRHCVEALPGGLLRKVYLCKDKLYIYLAPIRRLLAPESVKSLPPLDCLRFFEAAARHRSFVRAAEELGVTPPAVAHRIRMLESPSRRRALRTGAPRRVHQPQGPRLLRGGPAHPPRHPRDHRASRRWQAVSRPLGTGFRRSAAAPRLASDPRM